MSDEGAEPGTKLKIRMPDDFHHHVRDGAKTAAVLSHAAKRFHRCLIMPNTKPPIVNTAMALDYRKHILDSLPSTHSLEPLMTLYLTDKTTPEEIRIAHATEGKVVACKYYPAGATTNSDFGVSDVKHVYPALAEMEKLGFMLCIHSEVTYGDIFDREPKFLEDILKPLVAKFPKLKITLEHISTREAVNYVIDEAPDHVKASITCHHLLFNRNDMLVGGIKPHLYCLPILKAESHREALVRAAVSGSPKFFLGTDSAPHITWMKESACGCAGVFTAHAAVELYAETFDRAGKLDLLEDFCSSYGADHYGLPRNSHTLTLEKTPWKVPVSYDFGDGNTVTPLRAGQTVEWRIVEN